MENKIGETVILHMIIRKVVEVPYLVCEGCYFNDYEDLFVEYRDKGLLGECSPGDRKDRKNIIYKPLTEE